MIFKINDLLNLKNSETCCDWYIDLDVFVEEFGLGLFNYGMYGNFPDEIKSRFRQEDKMHDACNDGRSREVRFLYLDDVPFFFYQCVGKGSYRNMKIINKQKFNEFIAICAQLMLQNIECDEVSLNEIVEIDTYGANICEIKDNKLIAQYLNKEDDK